MRTSEIQIGSVRLGGNSPMALIAGPCVIESESHAMKMAESIAKIAVDLHVPYIYKASYDKANRTSISSYRGPGIAEGLRVLRKIKEQFKLPILSDVHDVSNAPVRSLDVWIRRFFTSNGFVDHRKIRKSGQFEK